MLISAVTLRISSSSGLPDKISSIALIREVFMLFAPFLKTNPVGYPTGFILPYFFRLVKAKSEISPIILGISIHIHSSFLFSTKK
jgi:hypothetical protein